MTLRERMICIYKNQMPDKPALGIYTRYLKRGYMERMVRNTAMGIIDYVPLTTQLGPPWHLIPEFISRIKDTDISIQIYFDHGERKERRIYKTPVGEIYAEVGSSIGDGSEHISKYYLSSPEDYRVMKYIVEHTIFAKNESVFQRRRDYLGEDGVVLGRLDRHPFQKLMIELAGAEHFLLDLYTDPDPILEVLHAMEKRMDEQFALALESEAEILWMPDNVTSDMTTPDCFRTYLLPYYKKYTALAHQAGKRVVAHFDGKFKVLVDMMNESGIDVIESVSDPEIGGDLTYKEASGAFPDKVVLPNFPANLAMKPREAIESFVRGICKDAEKKPFMLQVSEDLDERTYPVVLPILAELMK
jgi:hypothetical protein